VVVRPVGASVGNSVSSSMVVGSKVGVGFKESSVGIGVRIATPVPIDSESTPLLAFLPGGCRNGPGPGPSGPGPGPSGPGPGPSGPGPGPSGPGG
jgi:hypothetical protein